MLNICRLITITFLFSISLTAARAQQLDAKQLIDKVNGYHNRLPGEKIYLHLDKPAYAIGDTIWFKAYLMNAQTLKPSGKSGKIYIELINDSSVVVERRVLAITAGMGEGDISLKEKSVREGTFTIRAYTNWLQNFGESSFCHKQVYIGSNLSDYGWLINEQHSIAPADGGNKASLAINLHTLKNQPIANTKIGMRIMQGNRQLLKKDLVTTADGGLNIALMLPKNASTDSLNVLITETGGNQRLNFPLFGAGESLKADIQFMPEGGAMVANMLNKIAFKVIGEDGLGMDATGNIFDSKNQEVNSFATTNKGMGSFNFVPLATETYTAKVKLPGGVIKTLPLPTPLVSGNILRIDNTRSADSLYIYLTATPSAKTPGGQYTLLAQTLNTAEYAIPFTYNNGYRHLRLPKNQLPAGIVSFLVMDAANRVVNQRRVFIAPKNSLKIAAATTGASYKPQDNVSLDIDLADEKGQPLEGIFSVAVTDDNQVNTKPFDDNILSRMLLTSELVGYVENPYWYFANQNAETARALDNLMLTQGWTGIDAEAAINTPNTPPKFEPDNIFNLTGNVKGFLNKPSKGLKMSLLAKGKDIFMLDTLSNDEGKFTFKNLPLSDTIAYVIRATTKSGSSTAAMISLNEFKMPSLSNLPDAPLQMPWYAKTDTTVMNYLNNKKSEYQRLELSGASGNVLKEVVVRGRRSLGIKGIHGQDLYYADAIINAESFVSAGRMSLYDYLRLKVPGFYVKLNARGDYFSIKTNVVADFIIDGQGIGRYIQPIPGVPNSGFNQQKDFLEVSAADVLKAWIYHDMDNVTGQVLAYVMIQTRSGSGPTFRSNIQNYIYRPFPVYTPRQFYKPKYAASSAPNLLDLRSTIHWEPNLVADSTGKAKLSFYASSKPSTYTVNIQGTDLKGRFAVQTLKVNITSKTQ